MKHLIITISLLCSFNLNAQSNKKGIYLSSVFAFFPHEVKYGGILTDSKFTNQFYISNYLLGIQLKKEEGMYSFISPAVSYTRMYETNYLSIYPYLGKSIYYSHYGVKVEPLLNLQSKKIDFINIEINAGMVLGVSLMVGIPIDGSSNSPYWGFKVGYALFEPIFLTRNAIFKKHNKSD